MTKQAKILVSLACIILVAVIIQLSFFLYSQHQVKNINRQEAYAQGVTQQIDQYYVEQETGFIIEDMNEEDLVNIRSHLNDLEESEALGPKQIQAYNDLHRRYFARDEVNAMYVEPVITGGHVNSNVPYVENIDYYTLLETVDPYRFQETEDYFQETINLLIDDALTQTLNYETAITTLNNLKFIPVTDGYFEVIARGVKEAEEAYALVYNQTLLTKLNDAFQSYARELIEEINTSNIDVANHQELQSAMEISPYLKRLFVGE